MSPRRLLIAVVLVGLAAAFYFSRQRGPEARDIDVATVARTPALQSFVTASGEIVATRFADIGSSAMGRLVGLSVKEGDRVKAGQVLARIDRVQAASSAAAASAGLGALEADARGAADQARAAQAELDAAAARAAETQKALVRAKDLRSAGLIPQSDFDTAIANAASAAAQAASAASAVARAAQAKDAAERRVTQGRAEQTRARDLLDKTQITAPIDGVVTRLDVEEGEMVVIGIQNQPGTILMTVSDLSAINAEVKVAEADVLRLAIDNHATITIDAANGRTFPGRVVEIGASALPQVGTQAAAREFRVKVRLEGDTTILRPGLTCDAEILVAERANVLTVPLQAVVQRGADTGVFVVGDDAVTFTRVTTGIIGGLAIEVDGVPEGAVVVSGPFQALRELADGTRVKVRKPS
ncbi:MAG TPA: efflux RND transporter periplasmic adaptor subunit [Vicinamibacterales bacterium]|nr:efflux RND transporter periplasmic adaptor subunit [Vicinamibacterales bacterium]